MYKRQVFDETKSALFEGATYTIGFDDVHFQLSGNEELLKGDFLNDYEMCIRDSYNVSLSGGGDSGSYFVSAGYYNNDGVSYGNTFDLSLIHI